MASEPVPNVTTVTTAIPEPRRQNAMLEDTRRPHLQQRALSFPVVSVLVPVRVFSLCRLKHSLQGDERRGGI